MISSADGGDVPGDRGEPRSKRAVAILQARNELRGAGPGPRRFLISWCVSIAMLVGYYLAVRDGGLWSFWFLCVVVSLSLGHEVYVQLKAAEARVQIVVALLEELED